MVLDFVWSLHTSACTPITRLSRSLTPTTTRFPSVLFQTKAPNNVAFKVAGTRDAKSNTINGDIEGKYVDPKNGVTFTQTWTTSNILKTQVELENQIAKGGSSSYAGEEGGS